MKIEQLILTSKNPVYAPVFLDWFETLEKTKLWSKYYENLMSTITKKIYLEIMPSGQSMAILKTEGCLAASRQIQKLF